MCGSPLLRSSEEFGHAVFAVTETDRDIPIWFVPGIETRTFRVRLLCRSSRKAILVPSAQHQCPEWPELYADEIDSDCAHAWFREDAQPEEFPTSFLEPCQFDVTQLAPHPLYGAFCTGFLGVVQLPLPLPFCFTVSDDHAFQGCQLLEPLGLS